MNFSGIIHVYLKFRQEKKEPEELFFIIIVELLIVLLLKLRMECFIIMMMNLFKIITLLKMIGLKWGLIS